MAKMANTDKVLGGVVVAIDRVNRKAIVAFVKQDELFELPLGKNSKPVMGDRSWSLRSDDEKHQKVGVGTYVFATISGMKIERWCTRDRFAEVVAGLPPRLRNDVEWPHFSKPAAQTLMTNFQAAAEAMLKPASASTKLAEQPVAA